MLIPARASAQRTFRNIVLIVLTATAIPSLLVGDTAQPGSVQDGWLAFDGVSIETAPPTHCMTSRGLDGIVFDVTIPGILVNEVKTPDGLFHEIRLPGEGQMREQGRPMLPEILLMIAAPEFEDVAVSAEPKETQEFGDVMPFPCPAKVVEEGPEGVYVSKQFAFDEETYTTDAVYPENVVKVLHVGRIRDQKVIWLGVYPARYNGGRKKLIVHNNLEVSLTYVGARPSLATRGTGPFEDMCRRRLIGYDEGAAPGRFEVLGGKGGNLEWAWASKTAKRTLPTISLLRLTSSGAVRTVLLCTSSLIIERAPADFVCLLSTSTP